MLLHCSGKSKAKKETENESRNKNFGEIRERQKRKEEKSLDCLFILKFSLHSKELSYTHDFEQPGNKSEYSDLTKPGNTAGRFRWIECPVSVCTQL